MTSSIAFVGAGPTTLYALKALLAESPLGARITVVEAQATAGLGSPYRPGWNDPAMLSNIASAEIPPVVETLLSWLQNRPAEDLRAMGLTLSEIDDRAFVPRVVLGRFFAHQFAALVEKARGSGIVIDVRTRCAVVDVANRPEGIELTLSSVSGGTTTLVFDHVVLATGHQWPSQQEVRPGYFLSPWPATTLAALPATEIGLRGSSLTAIDAAVTLASAHGAFMRTDGGLAYDPAPGTEDLRITMMSRKGLLPEADFYFPLPHAELTLCTPEAIEGLIRRAGDTLLDDVFDLFRRELLMIDPVYAEAIGLAEATMETFAEAYFAERASTDPFVWAATNLEEARANHATRATVAWRDALLRMHEVLAVIVPHLNGEQFQRFSRHLKPVFVDAYGAVPHESVERMLALHNAGKLEVLALGDDYRLDTHRPEGGVLLTHGGVTHHFPIFIEATGQRPLGAIQFPFLSLLEQGIVRDETSADAPDAVRGIVIDDVFHPIAEGVPVDRLFCLSLPFIMGRHPFVQGITSSHEMGEVVGRQLALVLQGREAVSDRLDVAA